jgi:uncharacterized protein (DUF1778 family)
MPKRRDGIMTVRIPTDEKDMLQAIADKLDITLSDVVVKAVRDFTIENSSILKTPSSKSVKNTPKVTKKTKSRLA